MCSNGGRVGKRAANTRPHNAYVYIYIGISSQTKRQLSGVVGGMVPTFPLKNVEHDVHRLADCSKTTQVLLSLTLKLEPFGKLPDPGHTQEIAKLKANREDLNEALLHHVLKLLEPHNMTLREKTFFSEGRCVHPKDDKH